MFAAVARTRRKRARCEPCTPTARARVD
jgi:hypothetical protein